MARTNVKVIGTGGIGLSLLPNLCRFLNYEVEKFPEPQVSLVDGDEFEEKNRSRQRFSRDGKKATVTAEELRDEFPRIIFFDHPVFVDEDNVVRFVREGDIVLSCVDNHKTRKILSDRALELRDVTIINGGNDLTDGDVITHIRRGGVNITSPLACKHHHPAIANPTDLVRGAMRFALAVYALLDTVSAIRVTMQQHRDVVRDEARRLIPACVVGVEIGRAHV